MPFAEACRWVGGEENLKRLQDPATGQPIWSEDWRSKRSRWYKYKKHGVPAEVMWLWAVQRIETLEQTIRNYAQEAGSLSQEAAQRIENMNQAERQVLLAQMRELIRRALE